MPEKSAAIGFGVTGGGPSAPKTARGARRGGVAPPGAIETRRMGGVGDAGKIGGDRLGRDGRRPQRAKTVERARRRVVRLARRGGRGRSLLIRRLVGWRVGRGGG